MRKSGDRSENITIDAACNSTGSVILSPMITCKNVRMKVDLMNEAPEDTIFAKFTKLEFLLSVLSSYCYSVQINLAARERKSRAFLGVHYAHNPCIPADVCESVRSSITKASTE
jgi:hypothetical protein